MLEGYHIRGRACCKPPSPANKLPFSKKFQLEAKPSEEATPRKTLPMVTLVFLSAYLVIANDLPLQGPVCSHAVYTSLVASSRRQQTKGSKRHEAKTYLLRASPPQSRYCTRSVTFPAPPSTVFLAALQMRCTNTATLRLGTAGILFGWALQGYLVVGHCRDTLELGTAGILCSWALQGLFAVGHCEDT